MKADMCHVLSQQYGHTTCNSFLVSRDCCVALSHDALGLSAIYDCGIS